MSNKETIATVPVGIQDAQSLRTFLLKLVERLDIVLGYRGNFAVVSAEAIFGPEGISEQLSELQERLDNFDFRYPTGAPVGFVPTDMPEISETYEQTEVATIAEGVTEIQETLNSLLFELRDLRIISASSSEGA